MNKNRSQKQRTSCSKPFQENFKDESPLMLSIFAIIAAALAMLRRRTERRLTRANETPNEDKNNRFNKEIDSVNRGNPKKQYPNAADFAPSEQHASPLAMTTVGSCCLPRDAEAGRKRATNEEIHDIIEDGIFHEFNKGYKHEGGSTVCEHEGTSSIVLTKRNGEPQHQSENQSLARNLQMDM